MRGADGLSGPRGGWQGANLCEMTNLNLPVPPGFVISTEVCAQYFHSGSKLPQGLEAEIFTALKDVEKQMEQASLHSSQSDQSGVRSGAKTFASPHSDAKVRCAGVWQWGQDAAAQCPLGCQDLDARK